VLRFTNTPVIELADRLRVHRDDVDQAFLISLRHLAGVLRAVSLALPRSDEELKEAHGFSPPREV
jgi:hypothetical protein